MILKGDIVFSPFAGIGSEGFVALQNKRKFIGITSHLLVMSHTIFYQTDITHWVLLRWKSQITM